MERKMVRIVGILSITFKHLKIQRTHFKLPNSDFDVNVSGAMMGHERKDVKVELVLLW